MPVIVSLPSWQTRFPSGDSLDADTIIYALESLNEPEWYQLLCDLLEHGTAHPDIDRVFNTDRDFSIVINISHFIERATCPVFGFAADRLLANLSSDPDELHLPKLLSLLGLFAAVERGPPWDSIKRIALDARLPVHIRQFAATTLVDYNDPPSRSFWDDLQPRNNHFMLGPYVAAITESEPETALALLTDTSIPDDCWLAIANPMRQVVDSYIRKYGHHTLESALLQMEAIGRSRLQLMLLLTEFYLPRRDAVPTTIAHIEHPIASRRRRPPARTPPITYRKDSARADHINRLREQLKKQNRATSHATLIKFPQKLGNAK